METANTILDWLWQQLLDEIRQHPVLVFLLVIGFLSRFGVVIQTGQAGVFFFFGRVRRELEPGFHWMLPLVCFVRKVPVRSVTFAVPAQVVTTVDGLVYDVQANVVYRIVDPTRSVVQIGDLHEGLNTLLPLVVQEVLSRQTRASLVERDAVEGDFAARAAEVLHRWGVEIEQAGFNTVTPTRKTLRLTQLGMRVAERQRMLDRFADAGLSVEAAVTLLGSERRVMGRAANRYRRARLVRRGLQKRLLAARREKQKAEDELARRGTGGGEGLVHVEVGGDPEAPANPPPAHRGRRLSPTRAAR